MSGVIIQLPPVVETHPAVGKGVAELVEATVAAADDDEELAADVGQEVTTFFAPIWPTPLLATVFVTLSLR